MVLLVLQSNTWNHLNKQMINAKQNNSDAYNTDQKS